MFLKQIELIEQEGEDQARCYEQPLADILKNIDGLS
jgi:hypothetical protein